MTFNRLSIPAPARKHARAITLCTAAIAGIATPSLASAAAIGSTPAAPATAVSSGSTTVNAAPVGYSTTGNGSSASASTATSSSDTTTYTVVAGDTLFGIAQQALGNGKDYPKLFKLNKDRSEPGGAEFTDPSLIDVGWTLLVPAGHASGTASTTSSDSSSNSTQLTASTSSLSSSSTSSTSSSSATSYPDDLNGWIDQAVAILAQHGYTVSYNAVYETAMNESSGNPNAENNWDSNAAAGTPSIGLMQVIQPTFDAYALSGYDDIWNPVDNIIAAAIYAQVTYGGLDNVVAARCGGSCWYGY